MVKTKQNNMTIDDLAALIQRTMASKEDLQRVENIQRDMLEELNATHSDVRYIRSTVDTLVKSDISHDATMQDLTARVHRLEQKAGLAKSLPTPTL